MGSPFGPHTPGSDSLAYGNPSWASAGFDSPRVYGAYLNPLTDAGTADLHLVADDYTSGNWASRFGGYTAVLTGSVTKQISGLPGRYELTGFTTANAFKIAANAAHTLQAADTITYEFIVKTPVTFTASTAVSGYVDTTAVNIYNLAYLTNAGGNGEFAQYNTVGGVYLGGTVATSWNVADKYNLVTVVWDVAAPRREVYVNGTSVGLANTVSGTLSPQNTDLGIGARWSAAASAFQNAWDGKIVEIMRHRSAFNGATVTARAAQFNALKGY